MARKVAVFRDFQVAPRLDAETKRQYGDIHVSVADGSALRVGWVDKKGKLHEHMVDIPGLPLELHAFSVTPFDTPFTKMAVNVDE